MLGPPSHTPDGSVRQILSSYRKRLVSFLLHQTCTKRNMSSNLMFREVSISSIWVFTICPFLNSNPGLKAERPHCARNLCNKLLPHIKNPCLMETVADILRQKQPQTKEDLSKTQRGYPSKNMPTTAKL